VQHMDPDRLVILALGESDEDPAESAHLAGCTSCRTEIDAVRHVADVSAETQGLAELPPPPDRVWQAIAAGVARSRPAPSASAAPTPPGVRDHTVPTSSGHAGRGLPQTPDRRPGRRLPRVLHRMPRTLVAVAAAVLAIAGTVTVIQLTGRPSTTTVTARASLSPLQGAPANAAGNARVLAGGELHIHASDLPLTTGHYEVWLIDPDDTTKMVQLGSLNAAADVTLPIAPSVDLNRYRLVDVSAEANDGNSAHSGKSLLRGTLTS
jgi:hypothetical protein